MTTPGLPDFPKKSALARKIAAYEKRGAEHRRGEHTTPRKGCTHCRKE